MLTAITGINWGDEGKGTTKKQRFTDFAFCFRLSCDSVYCGRSCFTDTNTGTNTC